MRVLVTGATGFLGGALLERLRSDAQLSPVGAVRGAIDRPVQGVDCIQVGDIGPDTAWDEALVDVDAVVHTAARVHAMGATGADELPAYRRVNVDGTINLARQAVHSGVKRFIFISSIKVNGELTAPGRPFLESDEPAPVDPYGISKYEAEQKLIELQESSGMEVVVIRSPLVYGPGVKANFLSMMRWIQRGVPLPLGRIDNRRSFVALENLVDLIVTCISHPAAAGRVLLVADGKPVSITELLTRIGLALGKPARLIPIPASLLGGMLALLGKRDLSQRLLGSLEVDFTQTSELLDWSPVIGMDKALRQTAQHFLRSLQ